MKTEDKPHYLLHIFEDKDLKTFIKCPPLRATTRKEAIKKMKEYAYEDIVKGHYYFYKVIEQKMTTIEVYPSTETSE